jgi:hypothetical protein
LLLSIAQVTHSYYLAFYFQAVRGTNAAISGVRCLPYGIFGSAAILLTGALITARGYYVPFMWLGTGIFIVGSTMLRTLGIDSSMGKWVGYQIIAGSGFGLTEQVPFIAVQVVLPDEDMPTACALVVFSRCLGGAVGLSIAQNIFLRGLKDQLAVIPGVNTATVTSAGASDLTSVVVPSILRLVRMAFNHAITDTFIMPIVVAGIALLLSFGMERKWIEGQKTEAEQSASSVALPS